METRPDTTQPFGPPAKKAAKLADTIDATPIVHAVRLEIFPEGSGL